MKYINCCIVGLSFVASLMLSGQATAQTTIMAVGDSITQGILGECSYRRPLSQALMANSCGVTFVGSRTSAGQGFAAGNTPLPVCEFQNTNHQAVSGYRADQVLNNPLYNFANELNSGQPDIVVVHIGSNDIFQGQSVESTVDDVGEIIDTVFEQLSAATVVIADVIPWSEESVDPFNFPSLVRTDRDMLAVSEQLSVALAELVNERVGLDEAVELVEVRDGFDNDLMAIDGVHPNPVGEALIANRMLTKLYDLGVCNGAITDVQPPITYISIPSQEDEQLSLSPTLSGTALDEGGSGIDRVRIAIRNSAGEWLNYVSGTFSSTFDSSIIATMSDTTTNSTSWSITTDLEAGDYRLFALALDGNQNQVEEAAGNGQPARNAKVWTNRAFEVVSDGTPPPPAITSPAVGATLSPVSASFSWVDNGNDIEQWWVYAGSAESGPNQRSYDGGESLAAGTSSTVVTGLPGDGSTVYITLWYKPEDSGWKSVITSYTAASSGGLGITSPVKGSVLGSASETFTWATNGLSADEYWVYAGMGVNQKQYYDSGSLTSTSTLVTGLPVSGETVYVRLWHREEGGPWKHVDTTYTAASLVKPAITSPAAGSTIPSAQTFSWSANDAAVGEWWLYAGSEPGVGNYHNSGLLGSATSQTIPNLPAGTTVYVTLWYRADTSSSWFSVPYTYSVE